MPISISSSPSSKVGVPAAGTMHEVSAMPMLRPSAFTLAHSPATSASGRPASAAAPTIFSARTVTPTPRRPAVQSAVLHGHVVVRDDGLHLDAVGPGEVGGHLEVEHVAGVVLDDVQHAGPAVDRLRRVVHLVGGGGGEDLPRAGGIEHSHAHEAAVHRLMPRAAPRQDADLPGDRGVGPNDVHRVVVDPHDVAVRRLEAAERLGDDRTGVVDELLHHSSSTTSPWLSTPDASGVCRALRT